MKTDKVVLGNAFALTSGVYYVGCYVLALVAPQFFMDVSASWFHMFDLTKFGQLTSTNPLNFVIGLVTLAVTAWVFGFILGWSIEFFSKKK